MKKHLLLTFLFVFYLFLLPDVSKAEINISDENLYNNLKGKIILRVEANGEAYYVHPEKQKMYYLGRPADAFQVMREQGVGAKTTDIERIKTDNVKNYGHDINFAKKHLGKIFLQVEEKGEAWYINPGDTMRYYLGRPSDAFNVMRNLGLGITDGDYKKMIGHEDSNALQKTSYTNNKINISLKHPKEYIINEPTSSAEVVIIKPKDKKEYLQVQLLETTPPSFDIYRPNGANFIEDVIIDSRTAKKSFTNSPIGEGVLQGYSFTNYVIVIDNSKWIQIQYYGDNEIQNEFENIIGSIKFNE